MSEYANKEALPKSETWIDDGEVWVDEDEITAWALENPQPFKRDQYLGLYTDISQGTEVRPYNGLIQRYAKHGLSKTVTTALWIRSVCPATSYRVGMASRS